MKNTVRLNEAQLNQLISESVKRALNEMYEAGELEEGFLDNIKSAFKGAKQGYNYQKSMDRGTDGFKSEHDAEDVRQTMVNPLAKPENTAAEQANQLYAQAKEYMAMANRLKAQANKICRDYGLVKTDVGVRANAQAPAQAPVPAFTQGQGTRIHSNKPNRYMPTSNVGAPFRL